MDMLKQLSPEVLYNHPSRVKAEECEWCAVVHQEAAKAQYNSHTKASTPEVGFTCPSEDPVMKYLHNNQLVTSSSENRKLIRATWTLMLEETAGCGFTRKLKQVQEFKYLGVTLDAGEGRKWLYELEWQQHGTSGELLGAISDRMMPRTLKVKLYSTIIRPLLLYGAEVWTMGKKERILDVTEMRIVGEDKCEFNLKAIIE
ncbi:uncharacterized protein LOC134778905 [Penaeus indicus]|uniref:uncharacterized protein LOC134778905 n=1 Tax=Penaeus indicus TaxID=29960 RepID=UPI00300D7929